MSGSRHQRLANNLALGFASLVVAIPVAAALVVGAIVLVLALTRESPSAYAKSQVRGLFRTAVDRDVVVQHCRRIAAGDAPGEAIWACTIASRRCARTLRFAVNHEYGTEPYDSTSFAAINRGLCAAPRRTASTAGARGSSAAGIPCDLTLRFARLDKSYPGQFHVDLVFVSGLDVPCRVSGYPNVELIGPVYPTYGSIYELPRSFGLTKSVLLHQGQSAHAVLTWLPSNDPPGPYRWTPDYVRAVVHTDQGLSFAMALPWRFGSVARQDAATHPGTYVGPVRRGR